MEHNSIIEILSKIRTRKLVIQLSQDISKCIFFTTFVVAIIILTNRLLNIHLSIVFAALIFLPITTCFSLIKTLLNRESLFEIAQFIDERFKFQERISTAYETIKTTNKLSSFEQLQIKDADEKLSSIQLPSEFPYKVPKFAKLLPIGLILIAVSYWQMGRTVSLDYIEREAMYQTAKDLEKFANDSEIKEVIQTLRDGNAELETVQKKLAKLQYSIHKQREKLESELEKEIDKLTEQEKLSPELKKKLADLLKDQELNNLPKISEKLQKELPKMNNQLKELSRLKQVSKLIQNGQQRIGLSGLSVANRSGKPGEESGENEAIGREVDGGREEDIQKNEIEKEQIGKNGYAKEQNGKMIERQANESIDELEKTGRQNKLLLEGMESDTNEFSLVFAPELSPEKGKAFLQYQEVYLASQHELAEAIENQRIPVRYVKLVTDYFKAIAPNADEKR